MTTDVLTIKCMDITLTRLTIQDIEMVRKWRNHPDIKKRMNFRQTITKQQQLEWFNTINNNLNYYFLIWYKTEKIGLINAKNLNPKTNIGEGGIFIWDQKHWETPTPVLASILFLDVIFNYFKISNKSLIRVLNDNKNAISYNEALGYVSIDISGSSKLNFLLLTKEDFNNKLIKFKKLLEIYFKKNYIVSITGKTDLINHALINEYLVAQVH